MKFNASTTAKLAAIAKPKETTRQQRPAVQETQEFVAVLRKTANQISALLGIKDCALAVLDSTGNALMHIASGDGSSKVPEVKLLTPGKGIEGWVMYHQQALLLNDIEQDTLYRQLLPEPDAKGALVCVPLLQQGKSIGVIRAYAPRPYAFDQRTVHMLCVFSDQVLLTIAASKQVIVARTVTENHTEQFKEQANFFSMVAHELRSPLNAINGYLDLALTNVAGELTGQQREFIQRARAGSEHLYTLLEDLLLISRADSGEMKLNREMLHLPEIIANAVEELELSASDLGIHIQVDVSSLIPPIYADGVRLQQVLRNLISNALRFTPSGGRVVVAASVIERAKVAHAIMGGRIVKLSVSDTGTGIAEEYHERIFERFFQVAGHESTHKGGQGLGLAIVKMIVELHGGHVIIESEPGRGSIFTCLLPGL